jgi:hypothetical protein
MSYQVYDENGYVGDFASTKGLDEFMKWLSTTDDDELVVFSENSIYIFPMALKEVLEEYDPPAGDIKLTYDNFMELLPKCQGLVMISDGLNDDLEETE